MTWRRKAFDCCQCTYREIGVKVTSELNPLRILAEMTVIVLPTFPSSVIKVEI